jgi:hypothetical protein
MKNVCTHCEDRIKGYGAPAYDLFERVVDAYFSNALYIYFDINTGFVCDDLQVIEFLEMKYLILTSEIDRLSIGVIPNTLTAMMVANSDVLCWCYLEDICYGD